jgi:hypothetical protein
MAWKICANADRRSLRQGGAGAGAMNYALSGEDVDAPKGVKVFGGFLTAVVNQKGVLDVDTVKGCASGMAEYPNGGCYNTCYAQKIAAARGFKFSSAISRYPANQDRAAIEKTVREHSATWFRIGTMGDPCHNWELTVKVCEWLGKIKTPIIITKHWLPMLDDDAARLKAVGAIVNTSISPMDTAPERSYRLKQFNRLKNAGVFSVLRIVSARFGTTLEGQRMAKIQQELFENEPVIDNPLRANSSHFMVKRGDVLLGNHPDLGKQPISMFNQNTYVSTCEKCPDQCGAAFFKTNKTERKAVYGYAAELV